MLDSHCLVSQHLMRTWVETAATWQATVWCYHADGTNAHVTLEAKLLERLSSTKNQPQAATNPCSTATCLLIVLHYTQMHSAQNKIFNLQFYSRDALLVRSLPSKDVHIVRLSVCHTPALCLTQKDIKLFSPPCSPIIPVFLTLHRYTIPRGTPSAGAQNTQGEKNWRFLMEIAVYLGSGAR